MQIEDGSGSGISAKVNIDQRVLVASEVTSKYSSLSSLAGGAYSWTAVTADLAAGATALLVTNTSTTKKLHITKVYIYVDVPSVIKVHCPAYVAPAGTSVVGVNMNRSKGSLAEAVATANETNNVFAQTNVILSVASNELTTDQYGQWLDFEGALILGYHDSVGVDVIADSAAFQCSIFGYYHEDES